MEQETSDWILFFGRFHPLVLHLPIGFLVMGFLLEILSRLKPFKAYGPAAGFVLFTGAVLSLITAGLGLMLAQAGDYSQDLLSLHQWSGIAVSVISCAAIILKKLSRGKAAWDKAYLCLLVLTMGALIITGHYGGSLTHGSDYLTQYMPAPIRKIAGLPARELRAEPITNLSEAKVFEQVIYPILDSRCVSCHNETKRKGDLMMHTRESLLAGGENGAVFVPGNAAGSLMIKRIHLPETHDDHMPPKGKRQLTDEEVALLAWWIDAGAPFDKKVAELEKEEKIETILNALVDPDANKSQVEKLLATSVTPVDEQLLAELRGKGVIVRPLASEVHWLQGNVNPTYRGSGDSLIRAFSNLSEQLTWLDLGGSPTTDDLLVAVARLKNLTRLHLENTRITDKGLQHLKQLTYLEYLNLYGTKVTDSGIQALAALKNLQKLYVWQTAVTPDGISRLQQVIPGLEVNSGIRGKADERFQSSDEARADEGQSPSASPNAKK